MPLMEPHEDERAKERKTEKIKTGARRDTKEGGRYGSSLIVGAALLIPLYSLSLHTLPAYLLSVVLIFYFRRGQLTPHFSWS